MVHRLGLAVITATGWSAVAGAMVTLALWTATSPELEPRFPVATWLGLSWALAFVPVLVVQLGVAHLLLEIGEVDR